jgi:hypothetical protein
MAYNQPRLNRKIVFEATLAEFKPNPALQARLGYHIRRPKATKENIMRVAVGKVSELADRLARDDGKSKGYVSFDEAQKSFFSRLLAELYTWPELFDWRRGFVSQQDAYSRTSIRKRTGELVRHKGVDEALYELRDAGMTASQVVAVTHNLFFNYVDEIKQSEPGRFIHFAPAGRFYAEKIRPNLMDWDIGAGARARIDRGIMFILYFGMKRESGDRLQEKRTEKFRPQPASRTERQMELLMGRRDLVRMTEGLDSPVPLDAIASKVELKEHAHKPAVTNRFASGLSLGRPCRDRLLRRTPTA